MGLRGSKRVLLPRVTRQNTAAIADTLTLTASTEHPIQNEDLNLVRDEGKWPSTFMTTLNHSLVYVYLSSV
jgi:hypothetical protein